MMLSEHKGALALSGCLFTRARSSGASDHPKGARRTVPLAPLGPGEPSPWLPPNVFPCAGEDSPCISCKEEA